MTAAAITVMLLIARTAAAGTVIELGTLGGPTSEAFAISENVMMVVGDSDLTQGDYRAFLWAKGEMYNLGLLPGDTGSYATGVNNKGQVVGVSYSGASSRAFLWEAGRMQELPGLGGVYDAAYAINAGGTVVGSSLSADGVYRAAYWKDGHIHELPALEGDGFAEAYAINNAGAIGRRQYQHANW
ncbi:MAG TPA: hypothetical protein VFE23_17125 [Usitatibacter sp.]|jgi:probable HAF family extracellular repeat protein|nr:hypothetical protein [Usitatibacter sp.]